MRDPGSRPSRRNAFAVLAGCLLCCADTAAAQRLDATLSGTITDELGAPLAGAAIRVTGEISGLQRSATSGPDGAYAVQALPASSYRVRVEMPGFAPMVRPGQILHVGAAITIDFTLAIAGVSEHVIVAAAPLLETSKNTLARIVQTPEIDGLPVVARNFNDLADLAPGVVKSGAYGGVGISGSQDFQNAYQVDGVSAERQRIGDLRVSYAQDWIQEFQVLTGQYNAEFGQAAGGVLNAVTRSGGNVLHGRAYGFFRDDALDAAPALVARKPPLSEQRVGGTLGGPVLKNRLFYFAGVERFRSRTSSIVASAFPEANGAVPSTEDETMALAKIDAALGGAHRLRLRYTGERADAIGSGVGGTSTREHGRVSRNAGDDLAGGWTWIASSSVLSEARAGWSRSVPRDGCTFAIDHPAGTWFERSYPGGQFGCPVNFGTIAEDQLQLLHNLTWTRGAHEIKVGAQAAWTRSYGDFRNVRDGRYSFASDVPFSLEVPASYPIAFVAIDGPTGWDVGGWAAGAFAQDRWRVGPDLTVNAGLRYDWDGSLTALNPLVRTDRGMHPIDGDANNIAPRVGVAWTPLHDDRRTLVRGGVGMYYDQNHNNVAGILLLNNVLVDRIATLNANSPLFNPFWPDIAAARALLAQFLARGRTPDGAALSAVAGATNDVDRQLQVPSTMQASAGIAHERGGWLSASADVVYGRGRDQYVIRNVNLDPMTLRPMNPNYSAINAFGNGGWSRYRALQLQAGATWRGQRFLRAAYTLAAGRGNTDATLSAGGATNPFDYTEDEGPTDTDVRHALTVNGSTDLPGRVQLSGIFRYRSALPYSATSTAPRPDGKPFGFRPEPRNGRRGDSASSLDLRVATRLSLGAGITLMPFAEFFNAANTLNYAGYVGTVTSSLFGQPTSAGPRRRAQLGLRLEW